MALQSIAQQILKEVSSRARSFEKGVQRVVEVISPGPLGSKADSWDAQRRSRAAHAVKAAIERWEFQSRLSASRNINRYNSQDCHTSHKQANRRQV